MDAQLGVTDPMKSKRQSTTRKSKALKVVYISSPMKVKTSASNFRALVQELTGRDSDVAERFMGGSDVISEDDFVSTYKNIDQVQERRTRNDVTCGVPTIDSVTCPGQGTFYEPCNVYDMAPMAPYSQESSLALPYGFYQESAQLGAHYF